MATGNLIGKTYSVVADRYTFLVTGEETNGAYAVFEATVPPGGGSPPHIHHREDETFTVLQGEVDFHLNGEVVRLGPGQCITGKRGVPHHFHNAGTTEARMIFAVVPAGLEQFFHEIGTELPDRHSATIPMDDAQIQKLLEVAPRYGIELLPPPH